MDNDVSSDQLRLMSSQLRAIARSVREGGGIRADRDAAVDALIACSNSCDSRYIPELLAGLVDACEELAELAPLHEID